jgi:predicted TPR repeat methyltransferase
MGIPFADKIFLQAQQYHQTGQLVEAERLYRKVLENQPNHAGAIHLLGLVFSHSGKLDDAEQLMRRSIALQPRRAESHNNLGQVLWRLGRDHEAAAEFQHAITLKPRLAGAYTNIAMILVNHLRFSEAIPFARKAIELQPDAINALFALAQSLSETGQPAESRAVWQRVLQLRPNDPEARFVLAALDGEDAPPAAPATFVARLFNSYANNFDEHLVGRLGYQGPRRLRETIDRIEPQRALDVLDLGCGTGLVGAALRERAKTLVGVDLSPAMIEKSRQRGVYDALELADVTAAMQRRNEAFDLIVAGEVFVYIGDIRATFAAAAQALRRGGLFLFTIERHEGSGYLLHESRRYAHSIDYIRAAAAANHLTEVESQQTALRQGKGEGGMVAGAIVVLRK